MICERRVFRVYEKLSHKCDYVVTGINVSLNRQKIRYISSLMLYCASCLVITSVALLLIWFFLPSRLFFQVQVEQTMRWFPRFIGFRRNWHNKFHRMILFLVAMHRLASYYNEPGIFKNASSDSLLA